MYQKKPLKPLNKENKENAVGIADLYSFASAGINFSYRRDFSEVLLLIVTVIIHAMLRNCILQGIYYTITLCKWKWSNAEGFRCILL